jgi:hypothetical protein
MNADKGSRGLPTDVLKPWAKVGMQLEAESVQKKYGDENSEIGENSVDYVALIYMNEAATLFWLPKFLDYLQSKAPRDSFHYESMLLKLSDEAFVKPLRRLAVGSELTFVNTYLDWLATQSHQIELDTDRQSFEAALKLWS